MPCSAQMDESVCGKSLSREVVSIFSRSLRIAEVKGENPRT